MLDVAERELRIELYTWWIREAE